MIKIIIIVLMCYSPLLSGEWTQLSSLETSLTIPKIESIDENNIRVSGNVGAIIPHVFKSNDRGKTWNISLEDSIITDESGKVLYHPVRTYDLVYTDSLHAIMMCEGLRFWRTEDGGKNWAYDSLREQNNTQNGIITNKNYAIATYAEEIYFSDDFGVSWEMYKAKFDREFDLEKGSIVPFSITFLNDSTLIADGYYFVDFYHENNQYFILKSTNLGRNWEITYEKNSNKNFYYASNKNQIVAVGSVQTAPFESTYRDIIQISTDGGYTWEEIMDSVSAPSSILNKVEFINELEGIAFS